MRKTVHYMLLLFFGLIAFFSQAQVTITLKPGPDQGKDAQLRYQFKDATSPNNPDFKAMRWTCGGDTCGSRGIIEFDFSNIPPGSKVVSAYLSLFHNPTSSDPGHSSLSGSNACWLRRITTSWKEETVTWNTQPSTTTLHQLELPQSESEDENYTGLDITELVQDMINHPDSSYGLMILLQTETAYRSMIFASSDNMNPDLWPELELTYYADSVYCTTIKPQSAEGKDATVWSNEGNLNMGNRESLVAYTWTNDGLPGNKRIFLAFDMSAIPKNASIINAGLSLFYNPTDPYESFDFHTGENEIYIQRVINDWDEQTVVWDNQPNATTVNYVTVPPSSSPTQNYLDINVTGLIIDMTEDSTGNNGFLIKMSDEINYFKSVLFASSDHSNPSLHPELTICYLLLTNVQENEQERFDFKLYPNPADQRVTIEFADNIESSLEITNSSGQVVRKISRLRVVENIDISSLAGGTYFVRIFSDDFVLVKKLIVK